MKSYQAVYQILAKETDYISGEKIAEELSLTRTSIWKAIKRLEQEGIEIDSIKNKGYKLVNGDLILPELLEQNLPIKISSLLDNPFSFSIKPIDFKMNPFSPNQLIQIIVSYPLLYHFFSNLKTKETFTR